MCFFLLNFLIFYFGLYWFYIIGVNLVVNGREIFNYRFRLVFFLVSFVQQDDFYFKYVRLFFRLYVQMCRYVEFFIIFNFWNFSIFLMFRVNNYVFLMLCNFLVEFFKMRLNSDDLYKMFFYGREFLVVIFFWFFQGSYFRNY